jgi:hypothetical protein
MRAGRGRSAPSWRLRPRRSRTARLRVPALAASTRPARGWRRTGRRSSPLRTPTRGRSGPASSAARSCASRSTLRTRAESRPCARSDRRDLVPLAGAFTRRSGNHGRHQRPLLARAGYLRRRGGEILLRRAAGLALRG